MEEIKSLYDAARRFRKNCRICGEYVEAEEPFYTDGHTTVHMECFFDFQAKEVAVNECAL